MSRFIVFVIFCTAIFAGITFPCCMGQSEIVTGLFTIEQPGTGNCFTFDPADHPMDEDRVILTRCRERLPDGTQRFTVHALVDDGKFSLATADHKCFYGDSQNEFRRSKSLCDKSLNYFVTESAISATGRSGSDILIKQRPNNLCVNANLDGTINLAACDPHNPRQKWKVCRSEDSEVCLRYYEN
jgi:hypothetical protein